MDIPIQEVREDSFILQGNEAIYVRDFFDTEIVFIKENLPFKFKKYILAHELGHAILHTEVFSAAYNKSSTNKGKLERQADYFAFKLLDVEIDSVGYQGFTKAQIASALYIKEELLEYVRKVK